jgi:hypothetical protein
MIQKQIGQLMLTTSCVLCLSVGVPDIGYSETEMFGQFRDLKALQTELFRLPAEKQERLQPKVRQAELQACHKLREEQRKGVRPETYREEGGAELLAFVQQFDYYCQTLQ